MHMGPGRSCDDVDVTSDQTYNKLGSCCIDWVIEL